ncbi:hypothetical protein FRC09_005516 [Ceratobasidium sp. 395]|nr:hypothetical protein FRC09_005516 [Ceratobasidium sp. 395]
MVAAKILNFYTTNLQKDTSVVLVFRPYDNDKLYKSQFPVDRDNLVASSSWTEIHSEDTQGGANRGVVCENNSSDRADLASVDEWAIGFIRGDGTDQKFEPTLVCTGVNADSKVTTQFTPVLQAYVTQDYQGIYPPLSPLYVHSKLAPTPILLVSQLLRGEFETEKIWEQNVNELDDVTGWNFDEDEASGQFSITPAARA